MRWRAGTATMEGLADERQEAGTRGREASKDRERAEERRKPAGWQARLAGLDGPRPDRAAAAVRSRGVHSPAGPAYEPRHRRDLPPGLQDLGVELVGDVLGDRLPV